MGVANITGNLLNDTGLSLSSYLPLAGGTLTGALNGTSATFSSSVTASSTKAVKLLPAQSAVVGLPSGSAISSTGNFSIYSDSGVAGETQGLYYWNGSTYYSALQTSNVASGFSNLLLMKDGGNVGIGTSSPSFKLESLASSATMASFGTSSATGGYVQIKYNTSSINGYLGAGNQLVSGGAVADMALTSDAGNILFATSSGSERMRITSDGWVRASNTGAYITGQFHEFSSNLNNATTFRIKATSSTFTDYIAFIQADKANNSDYSFLQARSSNTSDTEFNLRGDGNAYADGSWNGGGADYAEYFEWFDGNPNNEDRRGYSVSLVGNKIKIAEKGETIIGVISGNPSVIGDSAWNMWTEKYLRDDFGTYVRDENGFRILNPNYNPDIDYISREERPEWGIVGLMGKLCMRKGQEVMPNWVKMKDVSDSVEQWLIK